MKRLLPGLVLGLILFTLGGCSSPSERFVVAALAAGTPSDDRVVLECTAAKLQEKLTETEFNRLIEDLEAVAEKEKKVSDISANSLAAMTVAAGACTAGNLVEGLLGGGEEKD